MSDSADKTDNKVFEAVDFDPFAGGDIQLTVPSTEPQKEVWASVQMGDDANCAFNESITLELTGELDVEQFRHSLKQLVQRHEVLRGTFSADGATLVINEEMEFDLSLVDLQDKDGLKVTEQLDTLNSREVETPFDLIKGPLFRCTLVLRSKGRCFVARWCVYPRIPDISTSPRIILFAMVGH